MADDNSPLLGESNKDTAAARPASQRSKVSTRSKRSQTSVHSDESTPLLSRSLDHDEHRSSGQNGDASPHGATSLRSLQSVDKSKGRLKRRWPTIIALLVLTLVIIAILCLGFAVPAAVEEYAHEAMVFEPTDLSIDSFTISGVKARIKGDFKLDASRVKKKPVRDLGRAGTWIAKAVESRPTKVKVYLPEYGNVLIGTASVPGIVVDIRNNHVTHVDFLTDLEPGEYKGLRQLANNWLDGKLSQLRIQAQAEVGLKSGIFSLGTQSLSETLLFEGHSLPAFPQYNITRLNFREASAHEEGMAVDVSLTLGNDYPFKFTVPPLGFSILVPNCAPEEPFISLASAATKEIYVEPRQEVNVEVGGTVRRLPDLMTATCPNRDTSPMDALLGSYIRGNETVIYVRGSDAPFPDTPEWISELTKSVTVPLPFPGRTFDNLIRDFSLTQVHLGLPERDADLGSSASQAKISAIVRALVNMPKEMNFPINVPRVRANADVYYRNQKLGYLDLSKWQQSNSSLVDAHDSEQAMLAVESIVDDAPLHITDDNVFALVVKALLFGKNAVLLGVKAIVDVETETALGKFIVRNLPAEGKVPVKPLSNGTLQGLSPKIGSLEILETTRSTIFLEAKVNLTNPTNYSATVPYVNINLLSNGTILGNVTAQNLSFHPGFNQDIPITALWDPLGVSGDEGTEAGRELLSQYISGFNTSLTLRPHAGSIPALPNLGSTLSSFLNFTLQTPRLSLPKNPGHPDDNPKQPHFIEDATMHLFTSTASFTLLSPLRHSILFINHINATAYYNHTDPVGAIVYDLPFAVPPGATTTPRLPVDWSLGSVGYDAVKQALGGQLKLDAKAVVGVGVGEWADTVWYEGAGIGASIRL